jgi:hypothetical protein
LPNGSKLSTASSSAVSFEETFLLPDGFFTKLGPQIRLLPVSNFSVNKYDYHIYVLLGKDQHLQARPDYRHSWGAEDTGNVDQTRLGRRLLLRLSSRCLFSGSSGRLCAPLSNRGQARHLCQEFLHGGGWATTTPSWLAHRIPIAFVTLLNGVRGRHLLQARELHCQHTTSRHKYSTTLFKMAYLLGRGLRDLQLLGHALAGHVARLPWRRGQASLQATRPILNERAAEP